MTQWVRWSACLLVVLSWFSLGPDTVAANGSADLPIVTSWSGEYPVAELGQLPEGQQQSRVGYIGDAKRFAAIWRQFKPNDPLPEVDFLQHLVVFSRNVEFFNRTNIFRVTLADGTLEVLAMETMSAIPVEDTVALALAVVPRAGIETLKIGPDQIITVE
ncbi:MAG: hypothetical protein JRE16_08435 [Deltaproteobacteria bacterium]|jgi:hypothetical protein|nr:hypothetical protein [Deltaproteobacteria bacterium]